MIGSRAAMVLAALASSSSLSCTRMPTAPEPVILVHGQILDPRGGAISNVTVAFEAVGASFGHGATPDKDGRYRIALKPGDYDVYFAISSMIYPGGGRVHVSPTSTTMDFTLEGFHVRGIVLDATGKRGERIQVGAQEAGPLSEWTSDVIDGAYSLFIPEGTHTFEIMDEQFATLLTTDGVPVHADTTIDFQFDRFPVRGTVSGADGKPDQGALISMGVVYGECDAAGRYVLYPPAGEIRIFCSSHDPSVLDRMVGPMTVAGPTTVDFDLRGIVWTGTVLRQNTNEVPADCYVVASIGSVNERRSAFSRLSSNGAFQVTVEPGFAYDLDVWHEEPSALLYRQTFTAASDTTFQLYVPPVNAP